VHGSFLLKHHGLHITNAEHNHNIHIPGFALDMTPITLSQVDTVPIIQSSQDTKKGALGTQNSPTSRSCRYAHEPIPCLIICLSTRYINFCMTSYRIMQTSTNPQQWSRCVDLQSIPPHTSSLTMTWSVPSHFLCAFLDCTDLSPFSSPCSPKDDDSKLDSYVENGLFPFETLENTF